MRAFVKARARQPSAAIDDGAPQAGQLLSEPCAASGCNGVGNGDKFRVVSNEWIQPLPHQP